ncbi:MAG: NAD-dependent epimerase/dehydratase family protein [Armatimonadota bacterium]
MKTLIIGGHGHTGHFLTRMLAADGQQVVVSTRESLPSEDRVKYVTLQYHESLADGSFRALLQAEKPDAVVDILQGEIGAVYDACRACGVEHLVACGSVWMLGRPRRVPVPEVAQTECPFEGYRKRYAALLAVMDRSRADGFPVTGILPPNICGPGKIPLEGMGGRSLDVHRAHRRGEAVPLPYPGTNLIGPCDAEDVALGYYCALRHRDHAAGEIFNAGSAYALTAAQFIATYAEIYGCAIPIDYVPAETYIRDISPEIGAHFHFLEHMCPDIRKISTALGYSPRFTPEASMERAVAWMFDTGLLSR